MIRISLAYPYDIGRAFYRLREVMKEGEPISSARFALSDAEDQLEGLFHPEAIYFEALRGAFADGNVLYEGQEVDNPSRSKPEDGLFLTYLVS